MPKITLGSGENRNKIIVSLCDYSGNWPSAYREAGYTVASFDLKHGDDVRDTESMLQHIANIEDMAGYRAHVHGVLAAPPCTDFTVSGARWWAQKDADGTTQASVQIVKACLQLIRLLDPVWWALENPVGRLPKLVPTLGQPWYFQPCEYAQYAPDPEADRYTKKTGIWGTAVKPAPAPLEPIMYTDSKGNRGSWMWAKLGGKSERTKELRSNTPKGFALAFFRANP